MEVGELRHTWQMWLLEMVEYEWRVCQHTRCYLSITAPSTFPSTPQVHLRVLSKTSQYETPQCEWGLTAFTSVSVMTSWVALFLLKARVTTTSAEDFVRWWEIAFPTFHISNISSKSLRPSHYAMHSSRSHTRFSHSRQTPHALWRTNEFQTLIKRSEILTHWRTLV